MSSSAGHGHTARRTLARAFRSLVDSQRLLSAVGVIAAGVLAVQANVLVSRNYERWDLTSHGVYTLSQPTRDLLGSLTQPVEITVLLSRSDRLIVDTRHMLDAYRAIHPDLRVRYVDPDAEPAEFLALQERHGITAGATQDGQLVTDASLIVSQEDRHWFVSSEELVHFDDDGQAQPRLEAALTEGIARVVSRTKDRICFTEGHGEAALDDAGPQGLAELKRRLENSNFDVSTVSLAGSNVDAPRVRPEATGGDTLGEVRLTECRVVVVAGPERPLSRSAAEALQSYVSRAAQNSGGATGGNLLLLLNPIVDGEGRLQRSGLGEAARVAGIELDPAFVLEPDPARRLPQGIGEAFFAEPKVHAITRGLAVTEQRVELRPLLVAAQPLGVTPDSLALPLLESSTQAFAVDDLRPLEAAGGALPTQGRKSGPFPLAYAAELPPGSGTGRGARVAVVGSANVAWSRNWRDPALFGTRLFTENALAWLADRPALVSVPERPRFPAGLSLTEESLGEVQRYVLLYMPVTAALAGLFLVLRRRGVERRSRREEAA
jgi:hypothetical protein